MGSPHPSPKQLLCSSLLPGPRKGPALPSPWLRPRNALAERVPCPDPSPAVAPLQEASGPVLVG